MDSLSQQFKIPIFLKFMRKKGCFRALKLQYITKYVKKYNKILLFFVELVTLRIFSYYFISISTIFTLFPY